MSAQPIETFGFDVSRSIMDTVQVRIGRLMVLLTQLMRSEYVAAFKVNNADGAASALTFEIDRTEGLISAVIGAGRPNSYLRYLEYGVAGTKSTPPGGALYSRTLAPPFANIFTWVRQAAIPIPEWMITRAGENTLRKEKGEWLDPKRPWLTETDPLRMLTYWTMIRIKQHGTKALHIIERVLTQQRDVIERMLATG